MIKKIVIIFLFFNKCLFSQLIVHSINDKRLIAYNDSLNLYLHGLKELELAKILVNKKNITIGKYAFVRLNKELLLLNKKIKPLYYVKKYGVTYAQTSAWNSTWYPEIWKNPVIKVVYTKIDTKTKFVSKKDTTKKLTVYGCIFRINGRQVSEKEFEKIYGRKEEFQKVWTDNY
jgi:hypothetical protein